MGIKKYKSKKSIAYFLMCLLFAIASIFVTAVSIIKGELEKKDASNYISEKTDKGGSKDATVDPCILEEKLDEQNNNRVLFINCHGLF